MAEDAAAADKKEEKKAVVHTYPLIRVSLMQQIHQPALVVDIVLVIVSVRLDRDYGFYLFLISQHSDMNDEMKTEAMELCVTACEKFAANNEVRYHLGPQCIQHGNEHNLITSLQAAAKMVKEAMDKKFGASWHVVVGEGYGFEITHEVKNILYMFFGGTMAIILWKCS